MTDSTHLLPSIARAPAWYGKLPGFGDFAGRRLSGALIADWDAWLQRGLDELRHSGEGWLESYLHSPVWRFALGAHLLGPHCWLGILMPSVDRVGRYFPLTILHVYRASEPPDPQDWWRQAESVALRALEENFDAQMLDIALADVCATAGDADVDTGYLPEPRQSLWMYATNAPRYHAGLPCGEDFVALFNPDSRMKKTDYG